MQAPVSQLQLQKLQQQTESTDVLLALSRTLNGFGGLMIERQDWSFAAELLQQARDAREELVQREPANSEFARLCANTIMNLGAVARNEGESAAAYRLFDTARAQHESLLQ